MRRNNMQKQLFLDDYLFRGEYEEMARALIGIIDPKSGTKIFNSAVELYIAAAVVGITLDKKANPSKGDKTLRIMATQFISRDNELDFLYRLVMLNADRKHVTAVDRINNAFKITNADKEYADNVETFEKYMLGGLKEIYSSFIHKTNKRFDDYLDCLNNFIEKFHKIEIEEDDDIDLDVDVFD